MPDDLTRVDDTDRDDDDDVTPKGIAKRLEKVARVMTRMNGRLEKISTKLGTPPDDMKPEILAALADIKTQSNKATGLAETMIEQVGSPPTDVVPG